MKLVLQIKLVPTKEQIDTLVNTIYEANRACNAISDIAWENKVFNQYKIQRLCYRSVKDTFGLSAQMIVRCIGKVSESYRNNKKTKRVFRKGGAIAYDSRILSYNVQNTTVSIWSVEGRLKVPFICHNIKYLPYIKGEADLVYKNGKLYLFQTVEIDEENIKDVEEFIGVDFGLVSIAATSDDQIFSSQTLNRYREKRLKIRSSLQAKGTRGAKKLLKRLSGREQRTATLVNHTISKRIVDIAKSAGKGIAIEDLTGIRDTASNRGKKMRARIGRWGFYQLRVFLSYKAILKGVRLVVIEPAYTSQMCNACYRIGKRRGEVFKCQNCNVLSNADVNAAKNIAFLGGLINDPEKSSMFSCALHI